MTDAHDPPPRIDWIEAGDLGATLPGRLGMTVLPGKTGASQRYPGRIYRADLDTDLAALRRAGVGLLVLLVEDAELARWSNPDIARRAADHEIHVARFPMPDGHAPSRRSEMDAILAAIDAARATTNVAVACMGGVGRTGTVAACALVAAGWDAAAAIDHVRAIRHPEAVETDVQRSFVRSYRSAALGAPARVGE
ncbi:MAG: protein-tyrosine-phosphatase [Chloroflexi bacterium]|nr:protein-tyrosine-phosphatase [Chloroflexota bacterium]